MFIKRSLLALLLGLVSAPAWAGAPVSTFMATQSGLKTLDEGTGGGNPFATAFINVLKNKKLTLRELPLRLIELTEQYSEGFQSPEVKIGGASGDLRLNGSSGKERLALVLIFSDYSGSGELQALPGARNDAERVAEALRSAGFTTETAIDPKPAEVPALLAAFRSRTVKAEMGLLYTTGHGVEVDGVGYLLPGDYPAASGASALSAAALRLDSIASALDARAANLFFYAGCRDNPFAAD